MASKLAVGWHVLDTMPEALVMTARKRQDYFIIRFAEPELCQTAGHRVRLITHMV